MITDIYRIKTRELGLRDPRSDDGGPLPVPQGRPRRLVVLEAGQDHGPQLPGEAVHRAVLRHPRRGPHLDRRGSSAPGSLGEPKRRLNRQGDLGEVFADLTDARDGRT